MWKKEDLPTVNSVLAAAGVAFGVCVLTFPFAEERATVFVIRYTGLFMSAIIAAFAVLVRYKPDWAVAIVNALAEKGEEGKKPGEIPRVAAPQTKTSDVSYNLTGWEFAIFLAISGILALASLALQAHWALRLFLVFVSLIPAIFGWRAGDCVAKGNSKAAIDCLFAATTSAISALVLLVIVFFALSELNNLERLLKLLFK